MSRPEGSLASWYLPISARAGMRTVFTLPKKGLGGCEGHWPESDGDKVLDQRVRPALDSAALVLEFCLGKNS